MDRLRELEEDESFEAHMGEYAAVKPVKAADKEGVKLKLKLRKKKKKEKQGWLLSTAPLTLESKALIRKEDYFLLSTVAGR